MSDDLRLLLADARTRIKCDVPGHGGSVVCFACDLRKLIAATLECIKELEGATRWILVSQRQPQRHGPHVIVRRPNAHGRFDYFLADPCYGMHAPWWVVDFDARNDTKEMLDGDEWKVLAGRGEGQVG